jgi:hypothetical protein
MERKKRTSQDSTRRPFKQGRPPARAFEARLPVDPPVTLDPAIIGAWHKTILSLARIQLEPDRPRPSDEILLRNICFREQEEIQALWESFTREREEIEDLPLNHRKRLVAYLLGFHLANAARATAALERLGTRQPGLLDLIARAKGPIHVSDLGCGTGALSLVLMNELMKRRASFGSYFLHLCDRNGLLLDAAEAAHTELGHQARVLRHRGGLETYLSRLPSPDRDTEPALEIYLAGYVWNEISRHERVRRMAERALESRAKQGIPALLVILDPANQTPSRALMELRDLLRESGWASLYPCSSDHPCPMLERPRDWCYSEAHWSRPPLQTTVDQWLNVDRSRLASSIHIMATEPLLRKLTPAKSLPVIVGRPTDVSQGRESSVFQYLTCKDGLLAKHPSSRSKKVLARGRTL